MEFVAGRSKQNPCINYISSRKGHPLLIYENRKYRKSKCYKSKNVLWRCSCRSCHGYLTIDSQENVLKITNHTCGAAMTNAVKKALDKLRQEAAASVAPVPTLYKRKKNLPPEVKQEQYQENHTSDLSEEVNDQLSGDDGASDVSEQGSDEDYVEEMDQNSNEPMIQNLYPKWLVQVERKRADAELIRAKAEKQRAEVATKSAEAALIQAEALQTLSEAASKQADAICRIATLFENRTDKDLLSMIKSSSFT